MRYIDADKQIERYSKKLGFYIDEEGEDRFSAKCEEIRAAITALYNAPTADVAEVVQSLWKKTANEKPDSTRHLIVADGEIISHYGYYLKPKDKWYKTYECEEEIEEIEVPTYWMDMPKPPKESIYGECCAKMDGKKVE